MAKTEDTMEHRRLVVLEQFSSAWNDRDVDGLMACMAEDCAFNASSGPNADGRSHVGFDAVRTSYAALFETFPKAAWTNRRHVVFGDTGLSSWRFVGTNAAGQTVEVDGCDIFAFSGALIVLKDSYRKART